MSNPKLTDTSDAEAAPPTFPSVSKTYGDFDKASVVLEERSHWDLADEGEEQSTRSWAMALFSKRKKPPRDPNAIATVRSVFDDLSLAPFYWPKQDYENIHRFDPCARWTYREEKAVVRKIDWKITFMVVVGCFALNLDRANISQANSTNFLSDLKMTTNDFNLGNTLYRVTFLCAELPSQLLAKRIGLDRWIPIQICLWSIVSLSQFWLMGRTTFLVCRILLGLFQGGFAPGLILYMSYFYTKTELPMRLAILWASTGLCDIVGSFMAYGILHLDDVSGKYGWRWLFLIEGLITLVIGVTSFFNLPVALTQTKTWFWPNGWLTEREQVIAVNKILRDDPTKGDMHNRESVTLQTLWTAICDYDMWPLYILGFASVIPSNPPGNYLTLLLRHARFSTFNTNLLTIPSEAVRMMNTFLIALVSELVNERTFVAMVDDFWVLPFLVALYALPSSPKPWLLFGSLTGLLSHPSAAAILTGWCSRNSGGVASRAVSVSLFSMFVQAGLAAAAQIYVASDAPRYRHGNKILIIICSINVFLLYPAAKAYYIWRNRQRAKKWDAMTSKEKLHYLNTTKDVGNRRLDFRFAH